MKKIFVILLTVLTFCMLTGCGSAKLSEAFDQTIVEEKAKEVITGMSEKEFSAVNAMLREDLKTQLTVEVLAEAIEQLCPNAGAFEKVESMTVVGQEVEEEDAAIAVAIVKYENQKVRYTVAFNQSMEVIGLYMK